MRIKRLDTKWLKTISREQWMMLRYVLPRPLLSCLNMSCLVLVFAKWLSVVVSVVWLRVWYDRISMLARPLTVCVNDTQIIQQFSVDNIFVGRQYFCWNSVYWSLSLFVQSHYYSESKMQSASHDIQNYVLPSFFSSASFRRHWAFTLEQLPV